MRLDSVKGMSNAEVKYMLKNCAWREATKMWAEELEEWPKLCVLRELVRRGFKARCVGVRRNTEAKGGYSRAAGGCGEREERKCTECDSEEVENVNTYYCIQSSHVMYLVLCNFQDDFNECRIEYFYILVYCTYLAW